MPDFSGAINAVVHIVIPVRDVVCESNIMTKHLRKALKWDAHPEIRFEIRGALVNKESIQIYGNLTIAGITRDIVLPAALSTLTEGGANISGTIMIDMRDYNMEPPVVSLLLLKAKVKPEVTLSFSVSTTSSWRNPTKPKQTERSAQ